MEALNGSYVWVAIADSSIEAAIRLVVASFQRRQGGKLPQYVWCPVGSMPGHDVVESWRQRGVTVSSHPQIPGWTVWAGPIT